MPCGWEGNRSSGVALAMRHRLQWFIHLRAHSLRKRDGHPAYTARGAWHSFTFTMCCEQALTYEVRSGVSTVRGARDGSDEVRPRKNFWEGAHRTSK